jgi:uracil-DNA glycosylase family 4
MSETVARAKKTKATPKVDTDLPARPLVPPQDNQPKSGCLFCPLLVWSKDFNQHQINYSRDAQQVAKQTTKERDGHVVRNRCVQQAVFDEVDILFIGDAPGGDEDRTGEPLIGRAGNVLRGMIDEFIHKHSKKSTVKIGFTNVVRCRPPRNKAPGKTEIECCIGALLNEIAVRKPRLLVALGGPALEAVTGKTGVMTFHNRIVECTLPGFESLPVLACYHPAYVLRMDHQLEAFADAFVTAKKFLDGKYEALPGVGEYYVLDQIELVEDLVRALIEDNSVCAFDTETGGLSPFNMTFPHLLCVSLSNQEGVAYTIPFDHDDSPWRIGGEREHERKRVVSALRKLFQSGIPFIAQNEKFDRNHLRYTLDDLDLPIVARDTLLEHYAVDERPGTHGLDTLAYRYTGMGGYDKPLEDYKKRHKPANPKLGGSYANIPGNILFPYAAMDADVTVRCDRGIRAEEEFKNPKLRTLSDKFLPQLSRTLARIEWNGATINSDVVDELDRVYSAKMETARTAIYALPTIRKFTADMIAKGKSGKTRKDVFEFNPGSTTQLRAILFDYYKLRPVGLTKTGFDIIRARWAKAYAAADKAGVKKPSFDSVTRTAVEKRQWEYFSTDKESLHEYVAQGNELSTLILDYREASTLHGTFIKPLADLLDSEGRIHGTYLPFGTQTGRLSSKEPNLQNIPNKDDAVIKRCYVSRFGNEGVILQLDYSQIELRVAASWFNEPEMLRAYKQKKDLHTVTAIAISGLSPDRYEALDDAKKKQWRTRAKRINFGVLYGGGPPALQRTLKQDGIDISLDECKKLIDDYFRTRPRLKAGIERLKKETARLGYLESFTGRRRRVPEVFSEDEELRARALRQSINFPIQSGASDMTLMSLVLIQREMEERGYRSKLILTVHDSIVFDCHVDEVFEVAELGVRIMETIPKLSEEVWPGLDWSWLRCPIVADAEIGVSWGQLVKFDPHAYDVDTVWADMLKKASKPLAAA